MLPNIAPPSRIGFLSGAGLALGNLSGIILFCFFLFAWSWSSPPLFGFDLAAHEPERAVGMLAGVWRRSSACRCSSSRRIRPAPRISKRRRFAGFAQPRRDDSQDRQVPEHRHFPRRADDVQRRLHRADAVHGRVRRGHPQLDVDHADRAGASNSVAAAIAAFFAGWLDTRIGSKRATIFFVAAACWRTWCCVGDDRDGVLRRIDAGRHRASGLFPTLPDKVFLVTQCAIAFFVTGGLATGRSLMAKISPPSMLNEFFGLFAMSGTAMSFIGPLVIGQVTSFFGNQRAGVAVGLVFLLIGLIGLFKVREQPRRALSFST